ncbi:MAG: pantoate--beta-alanine ligase [Solirubrobacteraceae bacterium]
MRTVRTVDELRAALAPARREGRSIGLVPTMGALHDGHLSLIAGAREQCDLVVVSLFVNPSQFNERADLERYPRDERRDAAAAAAAGADILFAPSLEEVYPDGFATSVEVLGVTERLEGAARGAEHFRGVSTVVTKLLCMTLPDVAYFGQKDAQQVLVIRRVVADLNLPVRIQALPTVRDADGLAMSSRNALLSDEQRTRALALSQALQAAGELAASGETSARSLLDAARGTLQRLGVQQEYLVLVHPTTLEPIERLTGEALLAISARIGDLRLIDNLTLSPVAGTALAGRTRGQPLSGKANATCSA